MEFVPALAMMAFILKVVDFLRYLRAMGTAEGRNGVLTQLTAWAAGVIGVMLFAQTAWADAIPVGDMMLGKLDAWSQVVVGLMAASAAAAVNDFRKATDNTQSAALPSLLPQGRIWGVPKD